MSNVDEMLRDRLRAMAELPVGSAEEIEKDVLGRLARRRRRRRMLSSGAVLAVVLLGGALVTAQASDDPDVAVSNRGVGQQGPSTAQGTSVNPLVSVAVQREVEGGENVVFTFEAPLPAHPPQPIAGIESLDPERDGIFYTTQGAEDAIQVCESRHFDFQPVPPPTGSVDLFFPAAWMAPTFNPSEVPIDNDVRPEDALEPGGTPGKIVGCGPYEGYIQYSIWAPVSDDLEDVSAYVMSSNHLVLEIRP